MSSNECMTILTGANNGSRFSSTDNVPLPAPGQLFQAISGRLSDPAPLLRWARDLSDLHAQLTRLQALGQAAACSSEAEEARLAVDRIICEIDTWAAWNVPRTRCAKMHTHSLGEVISHIAKLFSIAWWTLLHSSNLNRRRRAWFHLGEAREGYAEMLYAIRERHLQLPLGSTSVSDVRIQQQD